MSDQSVWLLVFVVLYWAFCLYWGVTIARTATGPKSFFLADRNLPAWVVAVAGTVIAFNGWMFLGPPDIIFASGFPFAQAALGAVTIALGSALFLKRQWMLGKRYGYVTPGEMFAHYYGSDIIRLVTVVVALLFAIPFVAMQLGVAGSIVALLTEGEVGRNAAAWILTLVVVTYVCLGGLRTAAYVGTLQGALMAAGIAAMGLYAYGLMGGFEAFNRGLAALAATAPTADGVSLFEIPGVMQFTTGLGVEAPIGGTWTGMMILSYCLALMGLTLNPLFSVLAFSSRSPKGFAPHATWASAGLLGALLVLFPVAQGFGGRLMSGLTANPGNAALGPPGPAGIVGGSIAAMATSAPWFAALLAVCAIAAVQSVAAFFASATATLIVRDIVKRYVQPDAEIEQQRLYARIGIGLILLAALLVSSFAPAAGAALGAMALSCAVQFLPGLAGLCWIPWITRPAATVGLATGIVFVVFTENFGISFATFTGIDLPWGRWPWTIHSAAWGLMANVVVVIVLSLISQREDETAHRRSFHAFLNSHAVLPVDRHYLRLVGWAGTLTWLFFAIGPGAVIGNTFFGDPRGGFEGWALGVAPIWGWQIIWWALGVMLIWFLAYRMGTATVPSKFIELAPKADRTVQAAVMSGPGLVLAAFWTLVAMVASATLLNWMFGP